MLHVQMWGCMPMSFDPTPLILQRLDLTELNTGDLAAVGTTFSKKHSMHRG